MSDFQTKQYVTQSSQRQYTSGFKDNVRSITQDRVEQVISRETPKVQTTTVEVEQRSATKLPRMQSQQVLRTQTQGFVGGQSYISNMAAIPQIGYQGNYSVQQNCVAAQPLCMNVIVVSKEEIEAPWRLECEYLQSVIAELEKRKEVQVVEKVVEKEKVVVDNSQVQFLESQLRQLRSENDQLQLQLQSMRGEIQLRSSQTEDLAAKEREFYNLRIKFESQIQDLEGQIRRLQEENGRLRKENNDLLLKLRDYENKIAMLSSEIERLAYSIKIKDGDLEDLRFRYEQLESQGQTVIQEKVTYLSSEVEVWKQKFIKVNHDYNECQEELTMCQAELEALRKGQKKEVVVSTSKVVTRTGGTTTTSSMGQTRGSRIYEQFQS
ncbi:unnamed protein product (macronuclear) [Paramecium tetraurelia]|uniref:Uncharacterized protein n=1 Tax=Paramecium tetraurelia TaxID=5888 RepID=A0BZZ3_PARTE|nr:uncharacterized protein GSPATT00005962001 [Paramecium tetraurelia]CAK64110.1 unnamed protein product [Paramecium tetraurelia]|eukprot:XP_001431508.1 hypothetical protein (macronuclear) [Paramecium tetraurelia strain d4-2]